MIVTREIYENYQNSGEPESAFAPAEKPEPENPSGGDFYPSDSPETGENTADYPGNEAGESPGEETDFDLYLAQRENAIARAMEEDLRLIRQSHPEVESLSQAPAVYRALRFNGYTPMTADRAYEAALAIEAKKPASTGSLGYSGIPDREYFTSKELDRLSLEDLKDPLVYKKAMKSLKRL